jgi:hypothetical protein
LLIQRQFEDAATQAVHCDVCPKKSAKKRKMNNQSHLYGANSTENFVLTKTALQNTAKLYRYDFKEDKWEIEAIKDALEKCHVTIKKEISKLKKGIKFFTTLFVRFYKPVQNDVVTDQDVVFRCTTETLFPGATDDEIAVAMEKALNQFVLYIYNFCTNGSGWIVLKYTHLDLNTVIYSPISTASFIALPKHLRNSAKGLINIRNKTNHKCIRYCLLAYYNKKRHSPSQPATSASLQQIHK